MKKQISNLLIFLELMEKLKLYEKLWEIKNNIIKIQQDIISSMNEENNILKQELWDLEFSQGKVAFPSDHKVCGCPDCGECNCLKCMPENYCKVCNCLLHESGACNNCVFMKALK